MYVHVAPKSREKLLNLVLTKSDKLKIELAVSIDVGEPFIKANYSPEGDGPPALKWYDVINGVKATIQVCHWPNTAAVAKKIAT